MKKDKMFRPALPPWLRIRVSCGTGKGEVEKILKGLSLNTVCEGAQCPNLNKCWHSGTATFMILGGMCTRNCKFCAVSHCGNPPPPDPEEPARLAAAAKKMSLKYVVVTSVTRDDLPDGGASHFAATIKALHDEIPGVQVEVLTPDFNGDSKAIETVLLADPTVFNHNVETVERLSPLIRSKADYRRSLGVLNTAFSLTQGKIPVKSGFMVGMGEMEDEIKQTIRDLRQNNVSILTIGQYLPPSAEHWKLERYATPEEFEKWKVFAMELGFSAVASGPLVRSSFNAGEVFDSMK